MAAEELTEEVAGAAAPAAAEDAAPARANPDAPTIVVLGGTGQTGKWFLKGAVLRGHNLRLVARSAKKARAVLAAALGVAEKEVEARYFASGQCTVIESDGFAVSTLVDAARGAACVASFVGMVQKGVNVVHPACVAVLEACEKLHTEEQEFGSGAALCPTQFLLMSTVGINDGVPMGRKAWGRFVLWCTGLVPGLKHSFADLTQAEQTLMSYPTSGGKNVKTQLNIVRCTILKDTKGGSNAAGLGKVGSAQTYELVDFDAEDALKTATTSFDIDRYAVAQAFLDLVNVTDKRLDRSAAEVKKYACFAKKV